MSYMKVSKNADGHIVLETTTEDEVKDILYPAGGSRLGPILVDSKQHLEVTKDAVPLLRKLFEDAGCDGDGFGDIEWSKSADGKYIFGWLGPNKVTWDPKTFGDADRSVDSSFQEDQFITV